MAMPSKYESFGISYIEAWSQQRPVLAAPESAAASFVENGVTGFLVSPDDPDGMVKALKRAIEEPEEMRRMGMAGQRLVEEQFRWDIVGNLVRKEYEAVLKGR
jgi:glycosyltransferase involved in cell wall biosynthesis